MFQACHGDVVNVSISDVVIHDSARGIGFQQRTGGGAARNWTFTNVTVLRTRGITGTNWWGRGEALWMTTVPETTNASAPPLGGLHDIAFVDVVLEGEQGAVVASRDQGDATGAPTGPGISGVRFTNVTVRVGVYGNATWNRTLDDPATPAGIHDFSPIDDDAPTAWHTWANVTGWWFEHVGPVLVEGGGVAFAGPRRDWWVPGVCASGVDYDGVTIRRS